MNEGYLAVIQAGGKGTRMLSLTEDKIPKPLLEINGKPMIQWQIENLKEYGITEFIIITGHLGEKIEEHFGNGTDLNVHISYIREEEPLGSAGALYYVRELIANKDVILVFGDVMIEIDWNRMISFHERKQAHATLLVHPNAHPFDSDLLLMNEEEQVRGIDSKNNQRDYWYENLVNAGIYILNNSVVAGVNIKQRYDLEKDVLSPLMSSGRVFGYRTPEYVKDAGTPKRFWNCTEEQTSGVWEKKCLRNKQKAIFLDRDGTINVFNGLISKEEQFALEKNAAEAIKKINSSGYLAICVTNQPVVARGMCEIKDINIIHRKMQTLLGNAGAYLDDVVFCPHHPDKGFPEENPIYKISCNCRKPATGMINQMVRKYNIDLDNSYLIGDSTIDIQTAHNAGVHSVLVRTGQAGNDGKYETCPEIIAEDILDAVERILL